MQIIPSTSTLVGAINVDYVVNGNSAPYVRHTICVTYTVELMSFQ